MLTLKKESDRMHKPNNHNISWQVVKVIRECGPLPKHELNKLLVEAKTDPQAREKAILHNLRLASWYARRRQIRLFAEACGATQNDCFDLAVEGLITAIDRYDPTMFDCFSSSYAIQSMRNSIVRGIASQFMSANKAELCMRFDMVVRILDSYNDFPSDAEFHRIAEKAPRVAEIVRAFANGAEPTADILPSEKERNFFRSMCDPLPLDSIITEYLPGMLAEDISEEGQDTFSDRLASGFEERDLIDAMDNDQRMEMLRSWVKDLKKPLREAVGLYYFQDGATLDSVADELGITKQAVKQRIDKALPVLHRKALAFMRGEPYSGIPPSMGSEPIKIMGTGTKENAENRLKAMGVPYLEYSLWDVERFDKTTLLSLAKKAMAEEGLIHYLSKLLAKKYSSDSARMLLKEGEDAIIDLARRMKEDAESRGKSF